MTLTITPSRLAGTVTPPPSKSQAHRLLIAAALAQGTSVIQNISHSQDMEATLRCLAELGAEWERSGDTLTLRGMGANAMSPLRRMAYPHLDCGESGSTLRFLIPVALAVRGGGFFTGSGRLLERPLEPYKTAFQNCHILMDFSQKNSKMIEIRGFLKSHKYPFPGDVSSQFISGMLFALPLLEGDSKIMLTSPLESREYVTMTLEALRTHGVTADWADGRTLLVPGNQTYSPKDSTVEADWSQAGFWYAAMSLENPVEVAGLDPNSSQGDRAISEYYVNLFRPGDLDIDVSGCPDLVPPLAAMAALHRGTVRLTNAARLRMKESDRLAAVREELCKLGARVEEGSDSLTITGVDSLSGGAVVDSHNDHRIAMMVAIAATRCERPVTLTGAEAVNKSYPNFWEDYARLGGRIETR